MKRLLMLVCLLLAGCSKHQEPIELYAFMFADEDGTEEVFIMPTPNGKLLPLVFKDKKLIDVVETRLQEMVDMAGKRVKLYKFESRELLKVYKPIDDHKD